MTDSYNLERFVIAQDTIFAAVIAELSMGQKQSHWMWFVFPQITGLGHSATAQEFAITGIGEAKAYLEHPLLGARLDECTRLVNQINGRSLMDIFGDTDAKKFRSSMTLFSEATQENTLFANALTKFCSGNPDPKTLSLLKNHG
jgi:uncharacterized protein (DUF1810 family)